MSRYIDADNAIERLGAYLMADAQIEYGGLASEDIDDWKPIAIDILKGAPSIDIVRCKECKHWKDGCRLGEAGEWYKFVDNTDEYGYNCDPRKTESNSEKPNNCEPQTDCGDFADRLAYERGVKHAWKVAQKVFDSTVTFYEAEDAAKQIAKDEPQTCGTCKYGEDKHRYAHICNECGVGINNYEPKDESPTERNE